MKLWEKNKRLDEQVERFTIGSDYLLDKKLVRYDCIASIAHARMLCRIGILSPSEAKKLTMGLEEIINLDEQGKFKIKKTDEDCHTAIENYLTKKLGETGKKIHYARSRNDQVLTALRMYYKDELKECKNLVDKFNIALEKTIEKYGMIKMPGYTHTRKAMPSSVGLWLNSFKDSMKDNKKLLVLSEKLIDQSPLGTGAGYGLPVKIDRRYTSRILGFEKLQKNPIYTQNSRGKFESTILHSLSQIMIDLNKAASDMIIFSMPEMGYFNLPEEICTGSSIMPQKKNPDVLEIVRGKYHEVIAEEFKVKGISSNLISGYNRDLQLTKEPVMKGFDITKQSLSIMTLVFDKLKINKEKCKQGLTRELYAAEQAYELVEKGMPFRDAYRKIAEEFE